MVVDLLLRWIHILSAIILVGGTFYQRFALLPALASIQSSPKDEVAEACRGPWAKWVMATSGLLLLSGLVNAVGIIKQYELRGVYHGLVAVKLVVALAIFWISAMLAGRSSSAQKFREKITLWLTVNVVLSVSIVCLGGYMRMERVENSSEKSPQVSVIRHN